MVERLDDIPFLNALYIPTVFGRIRPIGDGLLSTSVQNRIIRPSGRSVVRREVPAFVA